MILGREKNRKRAEGADAIADSVVRWLRPLCLLAPNLSVDLSSLSATRLGVTFF